MKKSGLKSLTSLLLISTISLFTFNACTSTEKLTPETNNEAAEQTSEVEEKNNTSKTEEPVVKAEQLPEGEGFFESSDEVQPELVTQDNYLNDTNIQNDEQNNTVALETTAEDKQNQFEDEAEPFVPMSDANEQAVQKTPDSSSENNEEKTTPKTAYRNDYATTEKSDTTPKNNSAISSNTKNQNGRQNVVPSASTAVAKTNTALKNSSTPSAQTAKTSTQPAKENNEKSNSLKTESTDSEEFTAEADSPENSDNENETSDEEKEIQEPSRELSMQNNQYVDIEYPGKGWIYLGENTDDTHLRYFGRKLSLENTSFTLRSFKPGETLLHFYKNDAIAGKEINDYLKVNVSDEKYDGMTHVKAPSYADAVPERPVLADENQNTLNEEIAKNPASTIEISKPETTTVEPKTTENKIKNTPNYSSFIGKDSSSGRQKNGSSKVKETTINTEASSNSDELLNKAQAAYDNKMYEEALNYLNQFFADAVNRIDEGLYLQGQVLEAQSSVRNMKSALNTYEALVKQYPGSKLWRKANERITYIKRFYFNIR